MPHVRSAVCTRIVFLVSTPRRSNSNSKNSLTSLDEILDNITKIQNPTRILHDLAVSELSAPAAIHKSSDMLYLTIGIIAGILLILIIILIVMFIMRIVQRKKFIGKIPTLFSLPWNKVIQRVCLVV